MIDHGDKELLQVLFVNSAWADGDVGELFSEEFAKELTKEPEIFLAYLRSEPQATRKHVAELLSYAQSAKDVEETRRYLGTISSDSPNAQVAEEIREALLKYERTIEIENERTESHRK